MHIATDAWLCRLDEERAWRYKLRYCTVYALPTVWEDSSDTLTFFTLAIVESEER